MPDCPLTTQIVTRKIANQALGLASPVRRRDKTHLFGLRTKRTIEPERRPKFGVLLLRSILRFHKGGILSNLFSSGSIGTLELPNRLVRSATAEFMADDQGCPKPCLAALYRQLAKGGVGLIITGATKTAERQELYSGFKSGSIKVLVVSKVANFAIDLPDANVAIQVSGTFGSRQEEAQRLGRILRPKQNGTTAYFYTVISRNTRDQDFSQHRQLFLTEQGYKYMILILKKIYKQKYFMMKYGIILMQEIYLILQR